MKKTTINSYVKMRGVLFVLTKKSCQYFGHDATPYGNEITKFGIFGRNLNTDFLEFKIPSSFRYGK